MQILEIQHFYHEYLSRFWTLVIDERSIHSKMQQILVFFVVVHGSVLSLASNASSSHSSVSVNSPQAQVATGQNNMDWCRPYLYVKVCRCLHFSTQCLRSSPCWRYSFLSWFVQHFRFLLLLFLTSWLLFLLLPKAEERIQGEVSFLLFFLSFLSFHASRLSRFREDKFFITRTILTNVCLVLVHQC